MVAWNDFFQLFLFSWRKRVNEWRESPRVPAKFPPGRHSSSATPSAVRTGPGRPGLKNIETLIRGSERAAQRTLIAASACAAPRPPGHARPRSPRRLAPQSPQDGRTDGGSQTHKQTERPGPLAPLLVDSACARILSPFFKLFLHPHPHPQKTLWSSRLEARPRKYAGLGTSPRAVAEARPWLRPG